MGNEDAVYVAKAEFGAFRVYLSVRAVYASAPWCSGRPQMRVRALCAPAWPPWFRCILTACDDATPASRPPFLRLSSILPLLPLPLGDAPVHSIAAALFASKYQIQVGLRSVLLLSTCYRRIPFSISRVVRRPDADYDRRFFKEIGYEHNPYTHCPKDPGMWERGRCGCGPQRSFDYNGHSCMRQWDNFMGL
ncbi:hypothetical protein B0H17DRAFT_1213531 [Mycena rosella]|uniref:Uncharacterized protein n=1 Tax=Mycena rosella TaxID=1033263 RepID=A0AAD7CPZ1_MYCRO|nr:hypothetical protein B0H17DRAFT_1213531 [Mycena rosella]